MSRFEPADTRNLDNRVVEQALHWMVALQSGTSSAAEQQACKRWREENTLHELAWQRLAGLNQELRDSTRGLSAAGARGLLQARGATSRRTLLKGFAGLGVAVAAGFSVRERVLLPELFSDYRTGTGERRQFLLSGGVDLNLDTRTALDVHPVAAGSELALNLGRVLIDVGVDATLSVHTVNGRVTPAARSRLIISQDVPGVPGTQVQMLAGRSSVQVPRGVTVEIGSVQQRLFDSRGAGPLASVPSSAEAWTRGLLIAERMPLGEVIAHLDRYRRGVLRCDPAVAALQVSGSFSLDRPEASLDLLTHVLPVQVSRVMGYWASVVPA